ncbi:MAG: toxin-antitoxin system HicB family antitoxin [Oscillospiraceae bacterium]|nr:toxin-antitoxin system HicB family antitoxin [Oscillospiraceae bacterium]
MLPVLQCHRLRNTATKYSERLMLRIPKELHKQLIEAAKENGVSLNQYALYKLAKQKNSKI